MEALDEVRGKLELIEPVSGGISLLNLKNDALLSYLNNLAIIIAAQASGDDAIRQRAIKNSIEQRVTLEKGVKGLESKISYQLDKVLRAYQREQQQLENQDLQDDGSSESEEEDLAAYKPNIKQLQAHDSDDEDTSGKYRAPKIAKTSLASKERRPHKRRDFAMEEYLVEQNETPVAEPSIGAAIMDGGRGGQSTEQHRRKEREIQDYEEANFTRIGTRSGKKLRQEAAKRQRDAMSRNLFGENWDFLDKSEKRQKGKKQRR